MATAMALHDAYELAIAVGTANKWPMKWSIVWTDEQAFVYHPRSDGVPRSEEPYNPPIFQREWLLYCTRTSWPSYHHFGDVPAQVELQSLTYLPHTTFHPYATTSGRDTIRSGSLAPVAAAQASGVHRWLVDSGPRHELCWYRIRGHRIHIP